MAIFFSGSELVNIAIGIERNGLAFYQSLTRTGKDLMARGTYKYLADMEKKHIKTFQDMLDTVSEYKPPEIYTEEYQLYLKALVDSVVFTDDKVARQMAEKITSSAEAIQIGLGAEKDSILYYSEMRNLVRERDRKVVDRIIEEEKSHLRQLSELKRKLAAR
jgi:rubrerythrin